MPRGDGRSPRPAVSRPLGRGEQIVDAWIHRVAIGLALAGVAALMVVAVPRGDSTLTFSLLAYGVGLLAMLTASAVYNGSGATRHKDLLRRLDHAAIFVMIAGTYTPFLATKMPEPWDRWLLIYVWTVAAVGVLLKLLWVHRFARLSVVLYLFLGWTIVVAFDPLFAAVSPRAVLLLAAGGVLYSAGVVFHLWERLPYQQPIWHGFVVAAAACHFAALVGEVALPGGFSRG